MDGPGGRGTIVATGTYDAGVHPRIGVIVEGLRERGWDVDEIVEPLRLDTAQRVEMLRRPQLLPRLVVALASAWWRLAPSLRARRRHGPRPTAVLVGHLGHFDIAAVRRLMRPAPVVLDFLISGATTADDRGVGGRLKRRLLVGLDAFALRRADLVVVDTQEHLAALPEAVQERALVVPVGADARWFDAAHVPRVTADSPMSVVFYGLFTPLQGTPVIAEALRLLDGLVEATVVGTGQDESEVDKVLVGVPGVTRVSWVAPDELPALVAAHDVCLGIFGTSRKALSVVPNKAFQGAAAGCVVVTGDTAPQRRTLGDTAIFVPPGDAVALAEALRALALDPARRRDMAARSVAHARSTMSAASCVGPLDAVLVGGL
ncbi:glycosyltransferase [Cellulomonas sp. McL0617]|uniref:glycosyltransferase n=1 Tax=Cellulomonas sp. McL0617 TaxID=3415675 RepID=UPI003CF78E74